MEDNIYEFVLASLDEAKGRWPAISTATGVPYQTLTKIAQRRTRNPGIGHIQSLADYFRREKAAAGPPQAAAGLQMGLS